MSVLELCRHQGRFTKRRVSAREAHPLIQQFVEICARQETLQLELARSGVDAKTIGAWEQGRKCPYLHNFEAVVNFLDYELLVLVEEVPAALPPGPPHPVIGWIAAERQRQGIAERQLCFRSMLSQGVVRGWERNAHIPTIEDAARVVRTLGGRLALRRAKAHL